MISTQISRCLWQSRHVRPIEILIVNKEEVRSTLRGTHTKRRRLVIGPGSTRMCGHGSVSEIIGPIRVINSLSEIEYLGEDPIG